MLNHTNTRILIHTYNTHQELPAKVESTIYVSQTAVQKQLLATYFQRMPVHTHALTQVNSHSAFILVAAEVYICRYACAHKQDNCMGAAVAYTTLTPLFNHPQVTCLSVLFRRFGLVNQVNMAILEL